MEFKIEPIKRVIIHNLVHESLDNFLHQCVTSGTPIVYWVNGIIIDFSTLFSSDESYRKSIQGIKYYEKLIFVKFPKYSKKVKWNGGNYEIILLNYNNNQWFRELAKWIKSQPVWKSVPRWEMNKKMDKWWIVLVVASIFLVFAVLNMWGVKEDDNQDPLFM